MVNYRNQRCLLQYSDNSFYSISAQAIDISEDVHSQTPGGLRQLHTTPPALLKHADRDPEGVGVAFSKLGSRSLISQLKEERTEKHHRRMSALQELLDEASRDGDINKLMQFLDPALLDKFDHDVPERESMDNPVHIAASHGHVDFISKILIMRPQLAEKPNGEGRLPLHLAAARGHIQVIEKLADHADRVLNQGGQNAFLCRDIKYGYMPAHIAAISGKNNIAKILVERCKDVLYKTTYRTETLLHLAVIANCLDSVRYFIKQGVDLNEKDVDGNTCLHLACKKRNRRVVMHLLDQEGIEVNFTNARGLTPLDIVLESSWDSPTDVFLVNVIRKAGGKEATERGNFHSILSNSKQSDSYTTQNKQKLEQHSNVQTLLVVATLVATMTFAAISNPPGGFVQIPFNQGDATNSTFYDNWMYTAFPAGRPVLLWQLKVFFVLDSVALFSSISVILFVLCGVPRTKILMKFLAAVLWLAAFCTALAFASALLVIYVPEPITTTDEGSSWYAVSKIIEEYRNRLNWVYGLLFAWFLVYVIAALWASVRVIMFLWRKGRFKRKFPNWAGKVGWPKNEWFRKTISIIFMICFLSLLGLGAWGLWLGFISYIADFFINKTM